MRQRLYRVARRYAVILGVGLLYFVFVRVTKIGIPCPFRAVTGLQCPGCGISRMAISLLRLDFVSAFYANPVILLTSPILLFCIADSDLSYIRTGKASSHPWCRVLLLMVLAALLVFGIVRNLI